MPTPSPFLTSDLAGPDTRPGTLVFCFPPAGGSPRAFLPWQRALGDDAELAAFCPPGRGHRHREPHVASVAELAAGAAEAVRAAADRPFVLFGHSLGAVVAFEAARLLSGHSHLRHLIASGCSAPSLLPTRRVVDIARLEGKTFTEAVGFFGGLPPEVIADEELAELLLPSLRADFRVVAGYEYRPGAPLDIPVTLVNGRDDPHVDATALTPWERECVRPPELRWADGGHFYFEPDPTAVTAVVRSVIADARDAGGERWQHVEVI
ncbi:Surfactin synthase thioesterase subunit [Streptomyces sp. yr375]|uniref:thioesterase II family protein n=1 Tax=Streptomyces sp. yr375 TaxID=1761906 RepID=UPI0008C54378|nr:alpha/beta fold hydrolase [Streptomyces sp. yr375]SES05061.1 Surfactin synthase thioesterase subunit [Streptomyces sp. yr375]